jgi:hypothetical protein
MTTGLTVFIQHRCSDLIDRVVIHQLAIGVTVHFVRNPMEKSRRAEAGRYTFSMKTVNPLRGNLLLRCSLQCDVLAARYPRKRADLRTPFFLR